MNAKEMFEKLGFQDIDENEYYHKDWFRYRHTENDTPLDITFNTIYKNYEYEDDGCSSIISVELHLAIHQQMKELGWIE